MAKLLESDRLVIRKFGYDDIPLLIAHSKEETRKRELPDEVFDTVEKATAQIRMILENYHKKRYPLPYAMGLKESHAMIGHILLCPIEHGIEIGYFISESYQNNGYATEAIKAFVPWAKETFHLDVLHGEVKKSNIASWKALEKAGFVFSKEKEHEFFGAIYTFKEYMG